VTDLIAGHTPLANAAITIASAGDIAMLVLWEGDAPDLAGLTALTYEPNRWWLIGAGGEARARIAAAIAGRGSVTPVGGGFACATLAGPGWREVLMHEGLFDAESPTFRVGDCAATVIAHVPVWIHAAADDLARVWFPVSYVGAMAHVWGLEE